MVAAAICLYMSLGLMVAYLQSTFMRLRSDIFSSLMSPGEGEGEKRSVREWDGANCPCCGEGGDGDGIFIFLDVDAGALLGQYTSPSNSFLQRTRTGSSKHFADTNP